MGQEIDGGDFTQGQRDTYRAKLKDETATLMNWFEDQAFAHDECPTVGLELEAWLIDENHLPAPKNDVFFDAVDDPNVVAELSQYNFEMNAPAGPLSGNAFSQTHDNLRATWERCEEAAKSLNLEPVMVGILPTVRNDMLQLQWMSDANRFQALNNEIMRRRGDRPLHIAIAGEEELDYHTDHLMLEAACTSLQAHLKINQNDALRFYNAAIIAAAPIIAATANSPFLYGKSLWHETRVPAFEQTTATDAFRDKEGRNVQRVTLGTGYLRESLFELFLENLSYADLLPAIAEDDGTLPHLRMQNGTIWRWVRPILGFDGPGKPHLRLEHRVMPAGPSLQDTVANLALCHGLVLGMGRAAEPPEAAISFEDARANFYACAKDGLNATVRWMGRDVNVQSLLLEELLPLARKALETANIASDDLRTYIHETLEPRIRSGQTGAQWQRSVIACHGPNFQVLTERYVDAQQSGAPVHLWRN